MAPSYIELVQQKGKRATVIKAWPSHTSDGTSCMVVTDSLQARAYCTEKLVPGQICKVTGTMNLGNAVFVAPVELDLCSTQDAVVNHEHRIEALEANNILLDDLLLRVEGLEDREIK